MKILIALFVTVDSRCSAELVTAETVVFAYAILAQLCGHQR